MSKKIIIAICACLLLVGATIFVMMTLTVNQYESIQEDLSNDMSLNSTESEGNVIGTVPIKPYVVIEAPVVCKPNERYVASKRKCERNI